MHTASRTRYLSIVGILLAGTVGSRPVAAQSVSSPHSGAWILGGTGAIDHADGATSTSIAPQALTFVMPRLAVGGEVVLSYRSSSSGHNSAWGLGPSARAFLADPASTTLPFVSA